jgi:hypothetical protein
VFVDASFDVEVGDAGLGSSRQVDALIQQQRHGRYGVPSEVLADNGKQFASWFTKPFPAEVIFERICPPDPRTSPTIAKVYRCAQRPPRDLLMSSQTSKITRWPSVCPVPTSKITT